MTRQFVWLLLFGSLWGISEVVAGGILYDADVPLASVWLTTWAVFVLAAARGMLNKPGTSSAIAGISALYKLINTAPFFCHILGILFLGMVFDLAASLLIKRGQRVSLRCILIGIFTAYGGNTLFALVMTYIIGYEYWVEAGMGKILNHIFVTGSFAACAAAVVVPLGYWIGFNGKDFVRRRPRWAYSFAVLFSLILWSLGRIIG